MVPVSVPALLASAARSMVTVARPAITAEQDASPGLVPVAHHPAGE